MLNKITKIAVIGAAVCLAGLAHADDHYSDSWEVEFKDKAESAGTISLQLTFEAGDEGEQREAVTVDSLIPADSKDKEIAKIVHTTLRAVLGDEEFKIKESGDTVEIDARGDTPDFVLSLASNSVQGISIEIDD